MTSKFAIHFTVHWPGQSRFSHSILIQDTKLSFLFSGTSVCAFISAVPIIKLFAWGEGDSGGHVLRETTIRGLCGLVCASHTCCCLLRTSERWCRLVNAGNSPCVFITYYKAVRASVLFCPNHFFGRISKSSGHVLPALQGARSFVHLSDY